MQYGHYTDPRIVCFQHIAATKLAGRSGKAILDQEAD
jgi:hypothetical protein